MSRVRGDAAGTSGDTEVKVHSAQQGLGVKSALCRQTPRLVVSPPPSLGLRPRYVGEGRALEWESDRPAFWPSPVPALRVPFQTCFLLYGMETTDNRICLWA